MQVDQLVRHGGHALDGNRCQRRIASFVLEFGQVTRCHLRTLARHFQQAVLVNLAAKAVRQGERLEDLETFDVFAHVARIRLHRRLAKPDQPCDILVRHHVEQVVERAPVPAFQ